MVHINCNLNPVGRTANCFAKAFLDVDPCREMEKGCKELSEQLSIIPNPISKNPIFSKLKLLQRGLSPITFGNLEKCGVATVPVQKGENIAYNRPTSMSTVYNNRGGHKAVDHNLNTIDLAGGCAATQAGKLNPYWMVDLGKLYTVEKVTVYNREGAHSKELNGFKIDILDADKNKVDKCGDGPAKMEDVKVTTVMCANPTDGQYVKVYLAGNIQLWLCEVLVGGKAVETETESETGCQAGKLWDGGCSGHATHVVGSHSNLNTLGEYYRIELSKYCMDRYGNLLIF